MRVVHDDEIVGEIATREDAEAMRETIRGREFRYGVVSNALDFALTGDERYLVYLSPRDRRRAESLAEEIRATIAG